MKSFCPWLRSLCALACGLSVVVHAAPLPPLFDKPLREAHLPLPRWDPVNTQSRPVLDCFYYPHVLVKQNDQGEVGAEQLSIVPLRAGRRPPACRLKKAPGERIINTPERCSYFKGVKGRFVFLEGAEGSNSNVGLAAFDARNGRKLFDDALSRAPMVLTLLAPDRLQLQYEKGFTADCSLRAEPAACWAQIRAETGLADETPPDCTAVYDEMEQQSPPEFRKSVRTYPSVIVYTVETLLTTRPGQATQVRQVSPVRECWPTE